MRRTAPAFTQARFGFSIQLATSSGRSISRKRIENCDARHNAGKPSADGMGLGMDEVELDGRRGRSFRLSSDGTGKQRQNQKAEAQYRQGLERCSGVNPRLKAE